MNIDRAQDTPDEFRILPNKPIQAPENYRDLPPPSSGGNRADATPFKDAMAALGGNHNALNTSGTLRGDPGIVPHAARFGVAPNIREVLAAEDLEFRKRNRGRILERAFNLNLYYKAYRRMSLDQYAELRRFRRAGVPTPSAPPDPAGQQ